MKIFPFIWFRLRRLTRCIQLSCLLAFAFGQPLRAAVLVQESFDYESGTLIGKSGGSGFSNAWQAASTSRSTDVHSVVIESLLYPDLPTSGNKAFIAASSPTTAYYISGATRQLDQTFNSGTVYASFLINLQATNARFGLSLLDGATQRLYIGNVNGGQTWHLYNNNTWNGGWTTGVASTFNTTFLMVLRIDFDASGTQERLRLYVNPGVGEEPQTPIINELTASFSFNTLQLVSNHNANVGSSGYIDEIRIGESWKDVVSIPEPSTFLLLLGSGGACLLLRRRFQKSA